MESVNRWTHRQTDIDGTDFITSITDVGGKNKINVIQQLSALINVEMRVF